MRDGFGNPLIDQPAEGVNSKKAAFEGRRPYVDASKPDSDPTKYAAPTGPVEGEPKGTPEPDLANKPLGVLPTAEDDGQSEE